MGDQTLVSGSAAPSNGSGDATSPAPSGRGRAPTLWPASEVPPDALDADRPERFLNRELSWLDFNARVLALAETPEVPLLERAKFLAIFSTNLDEFFQVRVAGLKDQVAGGVSDTTPDGYTPRDQLSELRDRIEVLADRADAVFLEQVAPGLAEVGIVFSSWSELDEDDREYLVDVFESRIFPVLTPLAVDPGHPFPYISDLSLNLAVNLRNPANGEHRFARVKVPPVLPRFVVMPDGERFVPLEQVIAEHLEPLFPGMEIVSHVPFRVTRNADLTVEDEDAEDLLAAVEIELRRRRFGGAVRLEIDARMSDDARAFLQEELDLEDDDVYEVEGPIDLGGLWAVHDLDRPDLKDPPYKPVVPPRLVRDDDQSADLFAELRKGDLLVHLPYDSFTATVSEFIRQASVDPAVLAIKLTLYRTSGDSPIIHSLIRAAERGKQVAALVELKARFDEQANIEWARALEEAGVHVVYGLPGLKIHTKTTLVIREESDGIRRYCHVGTGNYNEKTARIYEDLGLLTSDPALGSDLTHLFNHLTGYSRDVDYDKLLVAPHTLRPGISSLIQQEIDAGPDGRIIMKMNSLVDPGMIDELYRASQAGVDIDLIIRGICSLRPGVPGLSDGIKVRSIVGRYLEHSRIYCFANGHGPGRPTYLIGSADLMPRNLDRRVEALASVEDPALQGELAELIDVNLADDRLAWELRADGRWYPPPGGEHDTHQELQARAVELERGR
jgi:polyphosphate kinase